VTGGVFDYRSSRDEVFSTPPHHNENPRLDFRAALSACERLMAEQAASHGFSVERVEYLFFAPSYGAYGYSMKSSRGIRDGLEHAPLVRWRHRRLAIPEPAHRRT
jgi:hypothetical protein